MVGYNIIHWFISRHAGKNPEVPSKEDTTQINEIKDKNHISSRDNAIAIRPPPTATFYEKYQWEIWNCFEQELDTKVGRVINIFFIFIILFSVFLLIVETEEYFIQNAFII